jgi:hypothetical protein
MLSHYLDDVYHDYVVYGHVLNHVLDAHHNSHNKSVAWSLCVCVCVCALCAGVSVEREKLWL